MAIDDDFVIQEEEEAAPKPDEDEGQVDGDDGGDAGGDDKEGDEEADGKAAAPPRRTRADVRRDRAIEHRALTEERERRLAAERRADELNERLSRQISDAASKLGDAAARTAPPEKPLAERVRERVLKATKSIRDDDPATVENFLKEQLEAAKELGAEEARRIVGEELGKFKREQPQPVDPAALRLQGRFSWLFDAEHWGGVQAIRNQIAKKESRNLRDPAVLEKTTAEAAARWAGMNGLKIEGGGEQSDGAAAARARAAGTGGRNGSGAGAAGAQATGAAYVKARPWSRAQAERVFPNLKGDAKYKAFYDQYVKPELEGSKRGA